MRSSVLGRTMLARASGKEHKGGAPMTEAPNTEFTTEELLSQASGNATAFILTTIAYLQERG